MSGRDTMLREIGRLRGALVAVCDSLEVCNQLEAYAIASAALDDGFQLERRGLRTRIRYSCPGCGTTFRWPGELDHHRRFACPDEFDERQAHER